MPVTQAPPLRLPPGWARILEKAEQDIRQALVDASARDRVLDEAPPLFPPDDPQETTFQRLRHWTERLKHLEQRARQAEQQASAMEADLQASEEGVLSWLSAASALRQRLAKWERRAV